MTRRPLAPPPRRPAARPAWKGIGGALVGALALIAVAPAGAQPAGTAPATGKGAAQGAGPVAVAPTSTSAPILETYRFNARERTSRALAAWEKGQLEGAVAPLDSALRLQPDDPLVEFNAGTAHLGAKQPDAAQLLERAAKHAPPALAADAYYNLGNARLASQDARGAIDAYKSALRAQSDLANAKRNLELAVRLLEEQQRQQEQEKKDQEQKGSQDEQQKGGQGQENDPRQQSPPNPGAPQKPQPDSPSTPGAQPQPDPQSQGTPSGESQPDPQQQAERPLPQFQDQQDMTAEQAAAILQAVENLERQQRRDQARAVARAKTSVEKDW